ncbi:hypothetical protein BU26DRAFT_524277 [Trematosphaeria pertusa]|uniref:Uncharacterized protein n=1 Tax=Trematosphaeria pertusa TaxID=390896 RepID=A0A6A6HYB7_9PLEO|nr:uncharacterized protein BU26DRAFT_524277 [Trematosphaeria pertusa]KAF2242712.1 hypothetical protein BU26DRAFT_524277 [Trematosphaeria pertusa]
MGQSQSISTRIEIAASPEAVRSVLLDFQRCAEWTQRYAFSTLNDKQPTDLQSGDRIKVDMKGTVFHPTVVVKHRVNPFLPTRELIPGA